MDGAAIVFGSGGLLAHEVVPALCAAGWLVTRLDRKDCDITDANAVERAVLATSPILIVNCAAYTQVDKAESDSERAFAVNATGARNVARAAARTGARLVHFSTDYVFNGRARRPYRESDPPDPLGAYARSKLAGERAVMDECSATYLVRTGELYGDGGRNFFDVLATRVRAGSSVRVVADQTVSPTWTRDLALQLRALVDSDARPGVYHATSSGEVTWYDAARVALGEMGLDASVVESVTTEQYGSSTPRPRYSVLAHEALAQCDLYRMRPWRESLREWLSTRTAPIP